MVENIDTVRGFRDYTGEDAKKRERIREIVIRNFMLYGFEPAEPPIIEYEEFVKSGNQQDEVVSDVFTLKDKGERKLALRYEFTFQLKRISRQKKIPYKRFQIGPVFRDEPISGNRFRQFIQMDIDTIGSSIQDEAEILSLVGSILKELGISAVINVNNRRLLNEILYERGISGNISEIIREIDKLEKLPESQVYKNLKKYGAERILEIFRKPEAFFKKYKSYSEISELKKFCSFYNVKVNFQPSLARGLSYYNGSVFELKTQELKETIAGGGSYLINGIQSTGISFGLERLSLLAKVDIPFTKVLVISIAQDRPSINLVRDLRKSGISCSLAYGKITRALDYADSLSIPFTVFLGEDEVKKKAYKLRDMKSGREKSLSREKLLDFLKNKGD